MRQLIQGMIIGATITAAALGGYAYGTNDDPSDIPDEVATREFRRGNCDVQVGFGRTTFGDQCRFDQVMVGARDGYLLCADIAVDCPDRN